MAKKKSLNLAIIMLFFLPLTVLAEDISSKLPKYLKDHIFLKYPEKILAPSSEIKAESHYKESNKNILYIKIFYSNLNQKIEESAYFSDFVRDSNSKADIKYYHVLTEKSSRYNEIKRMNSGDFQVFETFGAIPDLGANIARYMKVETVPSVRLAYNGQSKFIKLNQYESFTLKFLKKLNKK